MAIAEVNDNHRSYSFAAIPGKAYILNAVGGARHFRAEEIGSTPRWPAGAPLLPSFSSSAAIRAFALRSPPAEPRHLLPPEHLARTPSRSLIALGLVFTMVSLAPHASDAAACSSRATSSKNRWSLGHGLLAPLSVAENAHCARSGSPSIMHAARPALSISTRCVQLGPSRCAGRASPTS